jgi:predicted nuclease with TOPRIM domain
MNEKKLLERIESLENRLNRVSKYEDQLERLAKIEGQLDALDSSSRLSVVEEKVRVGSTRLSNYRNLAIAGAMAIATLLGVDYLTAPSRMTALVRKKIDEKATEQLDNTVDGFKKLTERVEQVKQELPIAENHIAEIGVLKENAVSNAGKIEDSLSSLGQNLIEVSGGEVRINGEIQCKSITVRGKRSCAPL